MSIYKINTYNSVYYKIIWGVAKNCRTLPNLLLKLRRQMNNNSSSHIRL